MVAQLQGGQPAKDIPIANGSGLGFGGSVMDRDKDRVRVKSEG